LGLSGGFKKWWKIGVGSEVFQCFQKYWTALKKGD
jgi:hypothetical protein